MQDFFHQRYGLDGLFKMMGKNIQEKHEENPQNSCYTKCCLENDTGCIIDNDTVVQVVAL